MSTATVTVDSVLELLRQLPPRDQLRVVARAAPEVARPTPSGRTPLRSLRGLCADLGPAPSAEEIDEARREAWANFPREDI